MDKPIERQTTKTHSRSNSSRIALYLFKKWNWQLKTFQKQTIDTDGFNDRSYHTFKEN